MISIEESRSLASKAEVRKGMNLTIGEPVSPARTSSSVSSEVLTANNRIFRLILKRKLRLDQVPPKFCPLCKADNVRSRLRLFQSDDTHAIWMCPNERCQLPFNNHPSINVDDYIVERPAIEKLIASPPLSPVRPWDADADLDPDGLAPPKAEEGSPISGSSLQTPNRLAKHSPVAGEAAPLAETRLPEGTGHKLAAAVESDTEVRIGYLLDKIEYLSPLRDVTVQQTASKHELNNRDNRATQLADKQDGSEVATTNTTRGSVGPCDVDISRAGEIKADNRLSPERSPAGGDLSAAITAANQKRIEINRRLSVTVQNQDEELLGQTQDSSSGQPKTAPEKSSDSIAIKVASSEKEIAPVKSPRRVDKRDTVREALLSAAGPGPVPKKTRTRTFATSLEEGTQKDAFFGALETLGCSPVKSPAPPHSPPPQNPHVDVKASGIYADAPRSPSKELTVSTKGTFNSAAQASSVDNAAQVQPGHRTVSRTSSGSTSRTSSDVKTAEDFYNPTPRQRVLVHSTKPPGRKFNMAALQNKVILLKQQGKIGNDPPNKNRYSSKKEREAAEKAEREKKQKQQQQTKKVEDLAEVNRRQLQRKKKESNREQIKHAPESQNTEYLVKVALAGKPFVSKPISAEELRALQQKSITATDLHLMLQNVEPQNPPPALESQPIVAPQSDLQTEVPLELPSPQLATSQLVSIAEENISVRTDTSQQVSPHNSDINRQSEVQNPAMHGLQTFERVYTRHGSRDVRRFHHMARGGSAAKYPAFRTALDSTSSEGGAGASRHTSPWQTPSHTPSALSPAPPPSGSQSQTKKRSFVDSLIKKHRRDIVCATSKVAAQPPISQPLVAQTHTVHPVVGQPSDQTAACNDQFKIEEAYHSDPFAPLPFAPPVSHSAVQSPVQHPVSGMQQNAFDFSEEFTFQQAETPAENFDRVPFDGGHLDPIMDYGMDHHGHDMELNDLFSL